MSGILCMLMGAYGDALVTISNRTITHAVAAPGNANAIFELRNDGTVRNHAGTNLETYIQPVGAVGNYEAMVTVNSGTLSGGTAGSWLNLGSNRSWSRSQTGAGTSSCNFTVQVRNASTLTVVDTATITLNAEST